MAKGMTGLTPVPRGSRGDSHIAADSQHCSAILREIVTLVLTHGGHIHPGAVWREREGHMTVTCNPAGADNPHPLVMLPRELLVPITGAEWADSTERLILRQAPPSITPLQHALLDLHIELYNATGKIPWTVSHHLRAVAARNPAWLEPLRAIRPGLYAEPATPASIFLATRVFGLKSDAPPAFGDSPNEWAEVGVQIEPDAKPPMGTAFAFAHPADHASSASPAGWAKQRVPIGPDATPAMVTDADLAHSTAGRSNPPRKTHVLMPLIDMLNHHPRGAPFQLDDSRLSVRVAQPTGDGECFAAYGGRRDVLDLALHYGYLDMATPFAFSAPVNVEVEGLCHIRVAAGRTRPAHPLDPPRTQWDGETLELSHLCAHGEHPERLQTVLRLPLLAIARKRGHGPDAANRRIDNALERLCAANLAALDRVGQAARTYPGEPVATLLTQAVRRQAEILRKVMCGHGDRVKAAGAHRA